MNGPVSWGQASCRREISWTQFRKRMLGIASKPAGDAAACAGVADAQEADLREPRSRAGLLSLPAHRRPSALRHLPRCSFTRTVIHRLRSDAHSTEGRYAEIVLKNSGSLELNRLLRTLALVCDDNVPSEGPSSTVGGMQFWSGACTRSSRRLFNTIRTFLPFAAFATRHDLIGSAAQRSAITSHGRIQTADAQLLPLEDWLTLPSSLRDPRAKPATAPCVEVVSDACSVGT